MTGHTYTWNITDLMGFKLSSKKIGELVLIQALDHQTPRSKEFYYKSQRLFNPHAFEYNNKCPYQGQRSSTLSLDSQTGGHCYRIICGGSKGRGRSTSGGWGALMLSPPGGS